MISINPLIAGLVILAFIAGTGVGYLLSAQGEPATAVLHARTGSRRSMR